MKYIYSPLRQPPHETGNSVVVSLPDKRVIIQSPKGEVIAEFSAYVGTAKNPTPRGEFRIMENINPGKQEWYYGGHWLGFARGYTSTGKDIPYAGFHGWVYDKDDDAMEKEEPGWKVSTHGCVQLSNKDVAELAKLVGAGDKVTILEKPFAPPPPKSPKVDVKSIPSLSFLGGFLK